MFYLTCTMISSVDLAQYLYEVSRGKDWVSVDRGTRNGNTYVAPNDQDQSLIFKTFSLIKPLAGVANRVSINYSRTSVARTVMARLPLLFRTRS